MAGSISSGANLSYVSRFYPNSPQTDERPLNNKEQARRPARSGGDVIDNNAGNNKSLKNSANDLPRSNMAHTPVGAKPLNTGAETKALSVPVETKSLNAPAGTKPLNNEGLVRQAARPDTEVVDNNAANHQLLANAAVQQYVAPQEREQVSAAIKKPSVDADPKALNVQLGHVVTNINTTKLDENVTVIPANKLSDEVKAKIDIVAMSNSRSSIAADVMQMSVRELQDAKKADEAQKSAQIKLAFTHGERSAEKHIKAGKDARDMAITQSAVGITGTLAGGAASLKGNQVDIKGTMNHGNDAAKLGSASKALRSQSAPGTQQHLTAQGRSDAKINARTANNLEAQQKNQELQQNLQHLRAQKLAIVGNGAMAQSNNIATIASAQGNVTVAESQAESKMSGTNQEVTNANAQARQRAQENSDQKMKELMQAIADLLRGIGDTSSSIINNIRTA